MSFWTDFLIDKRKICSIYTDELPSLDCVDIHEILFHRDGPKVTLRFNFKLYPNNPPKKWVGQNFNTVQAQLTLLDIKDVNLKGWTGTSYIADIKIGKNNGLINLNIESKKLSLNIESSFLDITSISAYYIK
ncbi:MULTISPECIES: Imm50 family immunity protein [Photorhabdus]|uniref:Immunity protein 50 n=1 Tax=Photorhabdus thracensis TaxID=230089 RepID=A0A0F7LP61_9GAMM|nr:Imm50 family immunity protein [Photorhabdus thracensis]AKH63575.1 hypothetical protein VY86_09745 [Photorhabdus thracensis]AKH63582.1 hypothetical protein VY86_09790 [Photorhabdus thracensis]